MKYTILPLLAILVITVGIIPAYAQSTQNILNHIEETEEQIAKYQRQIGGHEIRIGKILIQIEENTNPDRVDKLNDRLAKNTNDIEFKQSEIIRLQAVLDDLYADLEPETVVETVVEAEPETVPETRSQTQEEEIPASQPQTESDSTPEPTAELVIVEPEPVIEIPETRSQAQEEEEELAFHIEAEQKEKEPIHIGTYTHDPIEESTSNTETEQKINNLVSQMNQMIGHMNAMRMELADLLKDTTADELVELEIPEREDVNILEPYVMTDKLSYSVGDTIKITGLRNGPPTSPTEYYLDGREKGKGDSLSEVSIGGHTVYGTYRSSGACDLIINEDRTYSCEVVLTEELTKYWLAGETYVRVTEWIDSHRETTRSQVFIIQ